MQRRIVDAEIVAALDSRVPREITDEILEYYLWRPELKDMRRIRYSFHVEGTSRFAVNGYEYSYWVWQGSQIHAGTIKKIGTYKYLCTRRKDSPNNFWEIKRKFWNGKL